METGRWLEEVNKLRDQLETFLAHQIFDGSELRFKRDLTIPRLEHDTPIVARLDLAGSTKRSGEIYRGSARMKQVKRPDVDRATS